MASRTPLPNSGASDETPEFTFHLIFNKPASGDTPAIVGAIVAGAVTTFIEDALGSAASKSDEPKPPKKSPPSNSASAGQMINGPKVKPKRRRRSAGIERKP